MNDETPVHGQSRVPVDAFEAFEDYAAYTPGPLTRARAITAGREACWTLGQDYRRADLKATRVLMRPVGGSEADEFFFGEYDDGWIEVPTKGLNAAQRKGLIPMWKIEPK